jgi:hypothetical protein
MNPFDYVKAINEKKPVEHLEGYNPFLTNMSLSYTLDTVMLANEMNRFPNLHPHLQFKFLYGAVRRGRRYGKWYKAVEAPHLDAVMEYYGYSRQKALEALQVLTQDNIRDILREMDRGGR